MTKRHRTAKASVCQTRRIKVTQTYYNHPPSSKDAHQGMRPIPWIQMRGFWLRQAGFEIDTPLTLRVMEGCLVLTVADPQDEGGYNDR